MSDDQPILKNTPLLQFLFAVCAAETDHSKSLRHFSGFDVLETNVATATARQFGFVSPISAKRLTLTPQGRAWALSQLAPLSALLGDLSPEMEG